MTLHNKHVVLTGGTGGIGHILAQALIDAGAILCVIDHAAQVNIPVKHIQADLSTDEGIASVTKELAAMDVDILINMAGIPYFGVFEQQAPELLKRQMMVNFFAPLALTQAVVPTMKRRGSGHIVNIGSIFGSINYAYFVAYSATKAGLKAMSEGLRRELMDTGIKVSYIAPRAVKTKFNDEKVQKFAALSNMKMDVPETVAQRIMRAIEKQEPEVYIGFPENIYVRLNAIFPRVIDKGLVKQNAQINTLFFKE